LVDGQGRIRRIRKFRQKLWALAAICAGSLLLTAVMATLYGGAVRKQMAIAEDVGSLKEEIASLQQQNELLKVRAVRMEALAAKTGEQTPSSPKVAPAAPAVKPPPPSAALPEKTEPAAMAAAAAAAKPEPPPAPAPAEKPEEKKDPQVDAERLKVSYQPESETIKAQFVIKNTGQGQAGGRAVVVLHTADEPTALRFALPSVPLREGRPRGNRGRRFSISRFMTLNLERKFAEPGTRFVRADIFAYSLEGKPLLEKTFDVSLEIPEKKAPAKATIVPSMQLDDTPPTNTPLGLSLPEPEPETATGAQP
jgi:hypothetical protein